MRRNWGLTRQQELVVGTGGESPHKQRVYLMCPCARACTCARVRVGARALVYSRARVHSCVSLTAADHSELGDVHGFPFLKFSQGFHGLLRKFVPNLQVKPFQPSYILVTGGGLG